MQGILAEADERVPDLDPAYVFDPDTTLAICAGFAKNRRVMVQGYHGTGKSTHIEQVAARLNWPLIRINLDAHISRIDLIGRMGLIATVREQRWFPVLGSAVIRYHRPLGLFDRYTLTTRIVGWDAKFGLWKVCPLVHWSELDYLNAEVAGDKKIIW